MFFFFSPTAFNLTVPVSKIIHQPLIIIRISFSHWSHSTIGKLLVLLRDLGVGHLITLGSFDETKNKPLNVHFILFYEMCPNEIMPSSSGLTLSFAPSFVSIGIAWVCPYSLSLCSPVWWGVRTAVHYLYDMMVF